VDRRGLSDGLQYREDILFGDAVDAASKQGPKQMVQRAAGGLTAALSGELALVVVQKQQTNSGHDWSDS
jgi:hypothetical protein